VRTADWREEAFFEPTVPRSNGAAVFDAPWQPRALALAVLSVEAAGCSWDDFRRHLITAIGEDDGRQYWDSWVTALGAFVAESGLVA